MMSHYHSRLLGAEEGAVAVTASILLSMLILLTAVVVDLGLLRMDERESQLAADMAASAALLPVDAFDPFAPGAAHDACQNAWEYIVANVEGINAAAAVEDPSGLPPCSIFGLAVVCNSGAPVPVTSRIVAPPYTIEITSPVLDAGAGHTVSDELMRQNDGQSGGPCERIGVRVQRDRAYILAGIAGFGSGTSRPSAVSRWQPGEQDNFASLIVLEQVECESLNVAGQGGINVSNYLGDPADPSDDVPGEITVDSDGSGSCGNSEPNTIMFQTPNQHAYIRADGVINSKALEVGNVDTAYNPDDPVYVTSDGDYRLRPVPTPGARELRQPVDHPLNCLTQAEYYSGQPWSPLSGWPEQVEDCDDQYTTSESPPQTVDRPAFVQRMHSRLQTGDLTSDAAWTVFPDDFPDVDRCSSAVQDIEASDTTTDGGAQITDATTGTARAVGEYLYLNCPANNGPATFTPQNVTISGVKVVVSANRISVGSSALFEIDGHDTHGSILYLRDGYIEKGSTGVVTLTDAFVYLSSVANGTISVGSSDTSVTWHGPLTDGATRAALKTACDDYVLANPAATTPPMTVAGVPPAACFGPATLWSNGTSLHSLGGQGTLDVAGTFYTPNAEPFALGGQGDQTLTKAQFFSRYLEIAGQGKITMTPNPDTNFETSSPTTGLIR